MAFKVKHLMKIKLKNSILIGGLPGIGNVGKVATDFMVENLKAKKIVEIFSYEFPHAVFVNEENMIDLPSVSVYHAKKGDKNILFLAGDVQPIDEVACYKFCDTILDISEQYNCKEIITLGGIGLKTLPKEPKVYCTANDKKIFKRFKSKNLTNNIFGVVGPIIGVSGLLPGLAKQRNIPAMILLAETFGHPNYLGIKGAREILKILNSNLKLGLDFKDLNREIMEIEENIQEKTKALRQVENARNKKSVNKAVLSSKTELSYIG